MTSTNRTISRFCKCGDLNKYRRRFDNLPIEGKGFVLSVLSKSPEHSVESLIRRAKKEFSISYPVVYTEVAK
jgi:hypothetical protein